MYTGCWLLGNHPQTAVVDDFLGGYMYMHVYRSTHHQAGMHVAACGWGRDLPHTHIHVRLCPRGVWSGFLIQITCICHSPLYTLQTCNLTHGLVNPLSEQNVYITYVSAINPRHKAQMEDYCNHIVFSVHPSVCTGRGRSCACDTCTIYCQLAATSNFYG